MKRRDDSGIGALDLVTVMLIVGALTSITVPVFLSSSQRVQSAVCASNRAAITARAISHQKLKGVYPTTMTELVDRAYFAAIPQCPGHGVYVFNSVNTGGDGTVYWSVHYAGKGVGTPAGKTMAAASPRPPPPDDPLSSRAWYLLPSTLDRVTAVLRPAHRPGRCHILGSGS